MRKIHPVEHNNHYMSLDYLLTLLNEIDIASQQDKISLGNHLGKLVEHLLKLQYWELESGRNYQYWQVVVFNSRNSIKELIKLNPSLKRYMEKIYPEVYQDALSTVDLEFYVPKNFSIELDQILSKSFFG